MDVFLVDEVFTPTKPARIAFIDRDAINEKLVTALRMPGKQLIVYGHSGSGKTTLLANKLHQLYDGHITTHCMKGMKFETIVLDAFDKLALFYEAEHTKAKTKSTTSELAASYLALQSKIQASVSTVETTKEVRALPQQLTPQALGKFLGVANYCWILEDFHKVDAAEKERLAQLMKVFMDLSDEYKCLKIVALGAVDTAREVVAYDNEMRNRVAEIHVDLMTELEIQSVVSKGESALNITLDGGLKSQTAKYSNGLASVAHHLCFYMCQAAGLSETAPRRMRITQVHFDSAIKLYLEEASDSIRGAFDIALKQRRKTTYDDVREVLDALSSFKDRGAARLELFAKIRKKLTKYPEANLKNTLKKLTTDEYGALVRFDQTSGLYSFADPIYRVFAMAAFHQNGKSSHETDYRDLDMKKLLQLLEAEIRTMNHRANHQ